MAVLGQYAGPVLDLDNLDLGDIADALANQFGGYEHLMLIDPQTGETVYWSADTGIDGNTPAGSKADQPGGAHPPLR
jgi:hypothetical protein